MQDLLAASFLIMYCIATSSFGIGDSQSTFNVVEFGAVGDGQTDDSPAFLKAWTAFCGAAGDTPTLEIPSGKTFLLQPTTFRGPCKSTSVHVQVAGNIVAPNSTASWKDCNTKCWLCTYDVEGLSMDGSGTIDGRGSIWWSSQALYFHNCNNFQMNGITLINSPKNHITINGCNGVSVANIHIDSPENSPNTDGIDISASTHVNILDSSIKSGDDCIAVNGACSFINVTGVACGPGHGISVGSLGAGGADDRVEEVHVRNCNFTGTQNGARIKTFPGGSGYARKISFEQITLIASRNPIIIDQHYCNGQRGCQGTSGVNVSEVTYSNVQGTSADEQAITLDCSENGCFNIKMDLVKITSTVPGKQTTALCKNAHGTSSSTVPQVPCLSG
ncbi:putative Pectin lyase-like superfamily protein [Melia azedarach]|uniref:Pectin lyase-like superfamily protein n=1 Tax=Melia azedarach TaxID=155640 RepID=A0ACC1XB20_MELAZ|nr:putative Pectin lyase-like superfamily protein [Melia azedarach]